MRYNHSLYVPAKPHHVLLCDNEKARDWFESAEKMLISTLIASCGRWGGKNCALGLTVGANFAVTTFHAWMRPPNIINLVKREYCRFPLKSIVELSVTDTEARQRDSACHRIGGESLKATKLALGKWVIGESKWKIVKEVVEVFLVVQGEVVVSCGKRRLELKETFVCGGAAVRIRGDERGSHSFGRDQGGQALMVQVGCEMSVPS